MASYDVNYRLTSPMMMVTVQADDYERAVHTAIEQLSGSGNDVSLYQTVLTPLGPDGMPLATEKISPSPPPTAEAHKAATAKK